MDAVLCMPAPETAAAVLVPTAYVFSGHSQRTPPHHARGVLKSGERLQARVGAPLWLAVIVTLWGVSAMLLAAVQNAPQFLLLRVLLGVFEAGTFPGIWCASPLHSSTPRGHAAG